MRLVRQHLILTLTVRLLIHHTGPFAGLLLADYGALVLRLDRPVLPSAPSTPSDQLTRRKTSIPVDLKNPSAITLVKHLVKSVDVIIDPFRPGVLEKLGLGPDVLEKLNPRVILARMTGFRRDGKYKDMAGHDINYIAVSGVLSLFGRKGEKPYPPGNLMGDFAGGGAMCFIGILLALFSRISTGKGQVVEANMVDGSAILATMPRLGLKTPTWSAPRGTNMLDGGAPFYDTYECADSGKYMAVGAIEPQFYAALLHGLGVSASDLPGNRDRKQDWPRLKAWFTAKFKTKTRAEWEQIFDGTDACCTPVFTHAELEAQGHDQRPAVTLTRTPAYAVQKGGEGRDAAVGQGTGVPGSGWVERGLRAGQGGEETLSEQLGWSKGQQYDVWQGGLIWVGGARL